MGARRVIFQGADGISLVADVRGENDALPVLFLHGGGQTRHAWGGAAERIAASGWKTVSLDLRGHGESDWAPEADYALTTFAEDCRLVVEQLGKPAVLVGASLGGVTALRAEGAQESDLSSGLVLVDIAPNPNPEGIKKIGDFMRSGFDGFATLDEAAAAIAAYTPHRNRETNYEGLKKVLRERDGRWYWHWDPAFMAPDARRLPNSEENNAENIRVMSNIHVPTMLVRGLLSDIVTDEGVATFQKGIPHATVLEVGGAAHMIAGDKNDAFSEAVIEFLENSVIVAP
jgi:pimeloyl-ACP methyl ester carboxylesterase